LSRLLAIVGRGQVTNVQRGRTNFHICFEIRFFPISYFVRPASTKNAIENNSRLVVIRDGVLRSLGGEVVAEKEMRLYGYPGREFFVKKADQGADDLYQWRIFLFGKRVNQIVMATERKDSGSPDIAKFFTSFNLN